MNSAFSPGLSFLCKIVGLSLKKFNESFNKYPSIDFIKFPNTPKSQSLIIRLVILLYKPYIFKNLGKEIISLLPTFLPVLEPEFLNINIKMYRDLEVLIVKHDDASIS